MTPPRVLRVVALVALVACKHEARETTPVPSLDPVPEEDAGIEPAKPPPTEQLGLTFENLDGPPASAPTGAAIQMKFVPPAVGGIRKRTQLLQSIHRNVIDGEQRLQETLTVFVLREQVLAVSANRVKKEKVTVEKAEETLVLNGDRHETPLLTGEYTVDVGGLLPKDMKIVATGRTMGTREEEELSVIVSMDAASTTPFHDLLWAHPLKLGEAVVLTDAEKKTFLGGDSTPAVAITFSLRRIEGGVATYQIDTQFDTDGEHRIVRQRYAIRIATGQIVEIMDATSSSEKSDGRTSDSRQQLLVRFE